MQNDTLIKRERKKKKKNEQKKRVSDNTLLRMQKITNVYRSFGSYLFL